MSKLTLTEKLNDCKNLKVECLAYRKAWDSYRYTIRKFEEKYNVNLGDLTLTNTEIFANSSIRRIEKELRIDNVDLKDEWIG